VVVVVVAVGVAVVVVVGVAVGVGVAVAVAVAVAVGELELRMMFRNATCETCRVLVSDIDRLVAYRLRCPQDSNGCILERVDLAGNQPWAGIRVICLECIGFFGSISKNKDDHA
jgi:hypothetical protein